ncbi:MAG: hypothetical protein HY907_22380 [Deltaproteobacteria bacterium]|nr:hypothetical protein [Deltaproteobacteria bacterium]
MRDDGRGVRDGDVDADDDSGADADADTDGDGDSDDVLGEAEAWPDAPPTCGWYELRSQFDEPCESGDSWVRDPFYEPGVEPVLRLVAVSGATTGPGSSRVITVRLRRSYRPVVLALGSYETVIWDVEREEGARLDHIYVYGYDPQLVTGADDVPVTNHSPGGDNPGYCYPFCGDHDTRRDVARIEAETGLTLRSFDGCSEAIGITLGDVCREECRTSVACAGRECGWSPDCRLECGMCAPGARCDGSACVACTPSCERRECGTDGCGGSCGSCTDDTLCDGTGACVPTRTFPGCADVAAESHYCLTLSGGRPALLGLDSGNVCPFGKPDLNLGGGTPEHCSIGWADGSLFVCVDRPGLHGLVRYTVLTDTLAVAPVPCEGVVSWHGGLLSAEYMSWHSPDALDHFATFDDALDGAGETWPWGTRGTRMTVRGDLLYSAWHSASGIEVQALPTGEAVRTIRLEGYDTWILGLSVADDGLLVLNAFWPEGRVAVFDEATGAWLYDVHPTAGVGALQCFVGS